MGVRKRRRSRDRFASFITTTALTGGDAGIGAGGTLAMMLLLGAGALGAVSIRRRSGTADVRHEDPERVAELTH